MGDASRFELRPIGRVESSLVDLTAAPKQGREGAPDAVLVLEEWAASGLDGLHVGDQVIVLTWLDRSGREDLVVHPRDDLSAPRRGVFSTRSASRPNPIGLHEVEVLDVDGVRLRVRPLEAVDGTLVLDLKPVI
jgi:tRNA-Thr(GGU) m(6)t(6)A37 methyltransferase TsaA